MTAGDSNPILCAADDCIAHHEVDIEVIGLELDAAPLLSGGCIRAVDGEDDGVGCCAEHIEVASNIEPPARGEFDDDAFLDGQRLSRHDDEHVVNEIRVTYRGPGLVRDDMCGCRRSGDGSDSPGQRDHDQ